LQDKPMPKRSLTVAGLFFGLSLICFAGQFWPVLNKVPFSEVVFWAYAVLFLIFGLPRAGASFISPQIKEWTKKITLVIGVLFGIWGIVFAALI